MVFIFPNKTPTYSSLVTKVDELLALHLVLNTRYNIIPNLNIEYDLSMKSDMDILEDEITATKDISKIISSWMDYDKEKIFDNVNGANIKSMNQRNIINARYNANKVNQYQTDSKVYQNPEVNSLKEKFVQRAANMSMSSFKDSVHSFLANGSNNKNRENEFNQIKSFYIRSLNGFTELYCNLSDVNMNIMLSSKLFSFINTTKDVKTEILKELNKSVFNFYKQCDRFLEEQKLDIRQCNFYGRKLAKLEADIVSSSSIKLIQKTVNNYA